MKRSGRDAGIEMQIDKNQYDASKLNKVSTPSTFAFEKADEDELKSRKIFKVKKSTLSQPTSSPFSFGNNSKPVANPFSGISFNTSAKSVASSSKKDLLFSFGSTTKEKKTSTDFNAAPKQNNNTTGFNFGSNSVSMNNTESRNDSSSNSQPKPAFSFGTMSTKETKPTDQETPKEKPALKFNFGATTNNAKEDNLKSLPFTFGLSKTADKSVSEPISKAQPISNPFSFETKKAVNNDKPKAKVTSNPFASSAKKNPFSIPKKQEEQASSLLFNLEKKGEQKKPFFIKQKKIVKKVSNKIPLEKRKSLNKVFLEYLDTASNKELDLFELEKVAVNYINLASEIDDKEDDTEKEPMNGTTNTSHSKSNGDQKASDEKDDENVGFKINDDEELLYNTRAKVMEFGDGGIWETKSTGTLLLIKAKDSDSAFVRIQNERTGRTTINLSIPKGLAIQDKSAKKGVILSAFSFVENKEGNLEKENEGNLINFFIRFKTSDEALEFATKLKGIVDT